MNHYILKCKECETVIRQCRCPAKGKAIRWSVCKDCSSNNGADNSTIESNKEGE